MGAEQQVPGPQGPALKGQPQVVFPAEHFVRGLDFGVVAGRDQDEADLPRIDVGQGPEGAHPLAEADPSLVPVGARPVDPLAAAG